MSTLTPGMQQYYEMKALYPDAILFFRMGDFYEMFGEDAQIAHNVLGINITSRNKNASEPIPLAGIPFHAKDKYLPILVNAGYKVAIAEQVSDPKLKGIVKREVVRVVTPATLSLEGENYTSLDESPHILALCEQDGVYGISFLNPASFMWSAGTLSSRDKLATEIYKVSPKEVILEKKLFQDEELKNILEKKYSLNIYYFDTDNTYREKLNTHFHTKNLSGFGIENHPLAIKSAVMLLEYLQINQKETFSHLESICYESFSDFLELDEATIRSLDLIYNVATKSTHIGTLFGVLDDTKTNMGKRFLRESILHPLKDVESIQRRWDIIDEFVHNKILLDKIKIKLKGVADLENIMTRLALGRANARDLINLKNSLQYCVEVIELIQNEGSEKLNTLLHL